MKIIYLTIGISLAVLLTISVISNTTVTQPTNAQLAPSSTGTLDNKPSTSTSLAPTSSKSAPSTSTTTTSTVDCTIYIKNYNAAKANYDYWNGLYAKEPGKYLAQWKPALQQKIAAYNAAYQAGCPVTW